MSTRVTGQFSLADSLARRGGRSERMLRRIDGLVDWTGLEAALAPVERARGGAPGYRPLMMLKVVLLQQWYNLSDPGMEDALCDRLSFRRFVGLALDETSPDHSTISRFRNALVEHKLTDRLFAEIVRQLDKRNLVLREGTMIDATLIEAAVKRPKAPETAAPADAAQPGASADPAHSAGTMATPAKDPTTGSGPTPPTPPDTPSPARPPSKLVNSKIDPDARWAKKGGKRTFGYKGHVGVDRRSGIIRTRLFTDASVADTTPADTLICGDEQEVYGDAAYDTHARRARLRAAGIRDRIAHRPNKHHPLTHWQARRNNGIGRRRSGVERVFATAKGPMGWTRTRYIGLDRNAGHFDLMCTACNIRRMSALAA